MIRAAIVGIGWWGRMLVNAVQGKSAAIRFTAGYTRTRATAEGFCAEHSIVLANDIDALLADPAVDAVVFATPHRQHGSQDAGQRARRSACPCSIDELVTWRVHCAGPARVLSSDTQSRVCWIGCGHVACDGANVGVSDGSAGRTMAC
jgi:hypothetical protein